MARKTFSLGSTRHKKYLKAGTPSSSVGISDIAYSAGWNGVTTKAPSQNAVYDKIETLAGGTSAINSLIIAYLGL